jgi:hypothetical protein
VAFSPEGDRLASASGDRTVKIWDVRTGQELFTFRGHTRWIQSMAFSPDGRRLASADQSGWVKVWDAATGQEYLTLDYASEVFSVAFSPDGTRLASTGADPTVKVWDAVTGWLIHSLKGHTNVVMGMAFSPDGTRLASASFDTTVKVWDTLTGQEAFTLKAHTGGVYGVAFSRDATRLATCGHDGTVRIWDARPWTPEAAFEAAIEREALGLLDFLFAKPLCKAEVIDYLQSSPMLRPQARQLALSLVDRYHEETDPEKYHEASQAIVCQPYLNVFQYRFALKQAETACRLAPEQAEYRATLKLAQDRLAAKEREKPQVTASSRQD